MNTKLYNIAVPVSEYTTKDGKLKKNWKNVGSVFLKEGGGAFIVMDAFFNPAAVHREPGKDSIILGLYKPKDLEETNQETLNDEIPF
jgi:hypothetical protein